MRGSTVNLRLSEARILCRIAHRHLPSRSRGMRGPAYLLLQSVRNGLRRDFSPARPKRRHNPQMHCRPCAHSFHNRDQFLASRAQAIVHPWWNCLRAPAQDQPVAFQLAKLRGQHLFAHAVQQLSQLAEPVRLEREVPQNQDLPFAGDDIRGRLDRTSMMRFHRIPSLHSRRLTKLCVLLTAPTR